MKEYEVVLNITDCTSVNAESEEEARQIAEDIFRESGYDIDYMCQIDVIEISEVEDV